MSYTSPNEFRRCCSRKDLRRLELIFERLEKARDGCADRSVDRGPEEKASNSKLDQYLGLNRCRNLSSMCCSADRAPFASAHLRTLNRELQAVQTESLGRVISP